MENRYNPYGPRDYHRNDVPSDYRSANRGDYSSARDYAAAGEPMGGRYGAREHREERDYGYRGDDRARGAPMRGRSDYDRGYAQRGYSPSRYDEDRGFFDRAGDEVRSWFGDEQAERRREMDQRYDDRMARREAANHPDDHYRNWRRSRIAELDRDYDEYRRENAQRFENEFGSWRSERQGQRTSLQRANEHMEVVGSDGSHVGTVDKVRGDRILLTKSDSDAGGHHHSIPSRWIETVDKKVTLRKTADEAKAHWKDEERSAMFSGDRDDERAWAGDHNLNRSFSGTY